MTFCSKTIGINEIGILKAHALGFFVHTLNKVLVGTFQMFSYCHTGIIG
jgi:hypothetical protein